jgi:hypothetical protein
MKLDRARQRMTELEQALQSFYATNPYKFSGKADLQAGKVVYTMDWVKDAPDEVSSIAGEVIQNLRSALDHLAYQLFLRGGGIGTGKQIYFPIGGSKTSYENKKSSQTHGMTQQAVAAIDALRPYKGGNDVLWQLHELNNVDKHRLILTVGSALRSTDLGDYFQQCAPPGSLLSKVEGLSWFVKGKDSDYPLKVGTVVFTDQTTTEIKKLKMRFELVLYEAGVIEGVSLWETMKAMVSEVEKLITDFQPLLV